MKYTRNGMKVHSRSGGNPPKPRHVASQAAAVESAVADVLFRTLAQRQQADRLLGAYLRERRFLGSRDRRMISEILYSVARWWGWLSPLAPATFLESTAAGAAEPPATAASDWARLFVAAILVEQLDIPPTVTAGWIRQCPGFSPDNLKATPIEERATDILQRLGMKAAVTDLESLVPAWALPEINCPKPVPELIGWLQRRPPLWLRIQHADGDAVLRQLAEVDPHARVHSAIPNAVSMGPACTSLYNAPVYKEGRVEIQDLSSQCVGIACSPVPGQRWWDCCAGGGGKALLLSSLMNGKGVLVASDIRAYKLQQLKHRARRGGFSNITTRDWNGGTVPSNKANFDGVLVDAPCTGSGTWRRNPWARWTLRKSDLDELSKSQASLLSNASTAVRPGGLLVYATCSMFTRENAEIIRAFIQSHPGFRLEPFRHPLTGNATDGMVQIWPWDGDCDAMFVARMRRS